MAAPQTHRNPVEVLAEDFVARLRQGEWPSIEDYVQQNPELAESIRELFPTIAAMERWRTNRDTPLPTQQVLDSGHIDRLGDFRIIREIGRGGMGVVYEAEQESLGRRVAVKVLPKQPLLQEKQLRRFEREARLAAGLHHTNIVPVFGVGEQDGVHYYVMQYIRGVGLDAVIDALQRFQSDFRMEASPETNGATIAAEPADESVPGRNKSESGISALEAARALCRGDFTSGHSSVTLLKPGSATGSPGTFTANRRSSEEHAGAKTTEMFRDASGLPPETPPNSGVLAADHPLQPAAQQPAPSTVQYWRSVARLGVQVSDALSYAHVQGILHRDIKPGNLLLDEDGIIWIADFGLAKAFEHKGVTKTGDIVGTLQYMAPEQFQGKYDARSDLYSLGATLYELLTLQPLFQDVNHHQLMQKILHSDPVRPRRLNRDVPRDLETIVLKMTMRDPRHRYQNAKQISADLERFLNDQPIRARRITSVERLWRWCRRNKAVAALSGLVFTLLLIVAVVASAGYMHTRDALQREEKQRQRAENTSAVALEVLEKIFQKLAPERVVAASQLTFEMPDGGEVEVSIQPVLSRDSAALLEQLLVFYDQLAAQDQTDSNLREQSAKANRRVGDIQYRLGQTEQALKAYHNAARIYQKLLEEFPQKLNFTAELASLHNAMGQAHSKAQDFDEARKKYLAAVEILDRIPSATATSPIIRYELARSYYNLGRRHRGEKRAPPRKGRPPDGRGKRPPGAKGKKPPPPDNEERRAQYQSERKKAAEYLNKAVDLLKVLVKQQPSVPAYKHLLALCYREKSFGGPGRQDRGDDVARQQAISLLQELVTQYPAVPDYKHELSQTLAQVGMRKLFSKEEPPRRLMEDFSTALRLSGELVARYPNVPDYKVSKAHQHHILGHLHRRKDDYSLAEKNFQQAVNLQKSVIFAFPDVVDYQIWRAKFQNSLASVLLKQEKLDEAHTVLLSSIDLMKSVVKKDQKLSLAHLNLFDSYRTVSKMLDQLGKKNCAAVARQMARKHGREFSRRFSRFSGKFTAKKKHGDKN